MANNNEKIIFVTNDKGIREPVKLDKADMEIFKSARTGEGLIAIESKEQLMAIGKALTDTFKYYQKQCKKRMTKKQAEFIRKLRVEERYSWRAVARACYEQNWRRWKKWEPSSSQPMGMALCEMAAEFFGEDYMKEPWN